MILETTGQNEFFQFSFEGDTVIEPGQVLAYRIRITSVKPFLLKEIRWQLPGILSSDMQGLVINEVFDGTKVFEKEVTYYTENGVEGFGEMIFSILYNGAGSIIEEEKTITWISVFERTIAGTESLDNELRDRLVSVVNFRARNGHIFLADYVSFFDDFLNIEVPAQIAVILSEDFALPSEGLPLDEEKYLKIITGNLTFYGMERLELLYEEDCNESDDRFDFQEATEVVIPKN